MGNSLARPDFARQRCHRRGRYELACGRDRPRRRFFVMNAAPVILRKFPPHIPSHLLCLRLCFRQPVYVPPLMPRHLQEQLPDRPLAKRGMGRYLIQLLIAQRFQ